MVDFDRMMENMLGHKPGMCYACKKKHGKRRFDGGREAVLCASCWHEFQNVER